MPDPRLFWYPGTCSRVVFVALEEIGLPFELVLVDKLGGVDPGYAAVNPKGKVPALELDGRVITENPAIHTFLARRHPEAGLLPSDPDVALEALETMSWFAAGVHPPINRQRFPRMTSPDPASHAAIRAQARAQLEEAFTIIEGRLSDREWLLGEWSIVDVYLLWLWFRATGSGMDGTRFPRCIDHGLRCEERPTVATVLDAEEAELARLAAAGRVPAEVPPFQAGRGPRYA